MYSNITQNVIHKSDQLNLKYGIFSKRDKQENFLVIFCDGFLFKYEAFRIPKDANKLKNLKIEVVMIVVGLILVMIFFFCWFIFLAVKLSVSLTPEEINELYSSQAASPFDQSRTTSTESVDINDVANEGDRGMYQELEQETEV